MVIIFENCKKTKFLKISGWVILFLFLYFIGHLVPEGFDWVAYFSKGSIPTVWTPWTEHVVQYMNWSLVVAITLFSIIFRTYHYNKSPLPVALAIISLPTLWVLYGGNIDGIVLLGLISLPWGSPLVLMKPQLASFALLARKSSMVSGIIWFLLTLLVWGPWPMRFSQVLTTGWKTEWTQDISLFPWGLLIALPLFWFSRKDEDLLMAAGSFATPHLFPYHFIILMPSLGRMNLPWMVVTWLLSWTPLVSNWVGDIGWHMGNILGLSFWLGIFMSKKAIDEKQDDVLVKV